MIDNFYIALFSIEHKLKAVDKQNQKKSNLKKDQR